MDTMLAQNRVLRTMRRNRHLRRIGKYVVVLMMISSPLSSTSASDVLVCPDPILQATRLLVAVAPDMTSNTGHARLFRRQDRDHPWEQTGADIPVSFGRNGLGWSFDHAQLAAVIGKPGDPVKQEGDGRSPAGIFPAGAPFGFAESALRDYIRIDDDLICVDDPASPLYNQMTRRQSVPAHVSRETMHEVSLYRRGMIIATPTMPRSAADRAFSCISGGSQAIQPPAASPCPKTMFRLCRHFSTVTRPPLRSFPRRRRHS